MNQRTHAFAVLVLALALSAIAGARQPASNDSAYRAATGLLGRGLPDQAAAEYRAFLRDHPDHPKAALARYGLAVCLSRLGEWKDAASTLDTLGAPESFEFAPDALLLRAQCALATSDPKVAAASLRLLLEKCPKFESADDAAALLGETLYRAGQTTEARSVLDRFGKEWPDSGSRPRAEFFLSLVEAGEGQDRRAAARLEALRAKWPADAVAPQAALTEAQCRHRLAFASAGQLDRTQADAAAELYRAVAQTGPESLVPDALLGQAQLGRAAGQPDQAGRVLDDLLKRFPNASVADAARIERARAFLDEGKPDRGLAVLEPVASSVQGDRAAEAAYWAAKCELKLDRPAPAAKRLASAIKSHPQSGLQPEMRYDLALALSRAGGGDAASARRAFADMRDRFPDHPLAAEALAAEASLAFSTGDGEAAAELCAEFLRSYPSHPHAASVSLVLADADMAAGRADRAERVYAAFLTQHPEDPRAADIALRRGLTLASLGRPEEAIALLEPVVSRPAKADPALVRAASLVLADAAMAASEWARAERLLRAVTTSSEGRPPDVLLKLGVCLQRQGRGEDAIALFEEVERTPGAGPAGTQAAFEHAQILVDLRRDDLAGRGFQRVIDAERSSGETRFTLHAVRHLASIASRAGDSERAAQLLAQIAQSPDAGAAASDALYDQATALLSAGKYEQADAAFDRFLRSYADHPRFADAAAQRAIAASRLGDYEKSLQLLAAADRRSSAMRPEILAASRYERAWLLTNLGRVEEAERAYEQFLADEHSAGGSLEAHAALDLAQLFIAAQRYADALPRLARAETAAKGAAGDDGRVVTERSLYLRGLCELKLDRAKDAAATLEQFLDLYPRSDLASAAGLLAGQALLISNRPDRAADRLRAVVDSGPPDETLAPALLSLGEACAAAQRWDDSRAAFEQYLVRFKDAELGFQARFGTAWALENQGRHAEAIVIYRDVVARHAGPTAARAQFQIGECLFATKQLDEAVRELLKVDILYAYPEWSAAALYEAGRCFSQLNRPDEARRQFQQVIDRFSESDWAGLSARQLKDIAPAPLPGRAADATEPR